MPVDFVANPHHVMPGSIYVGGEGADGRLRCSARVPNIKPQIMGRIVAATIQRKLFTAIAVTKGNDAVVVIDYALLEPAFHRKLAVDVGGRGEVDIGRDRSHVAVVG